MAIAFLAPGLSQWQPVCRLSVTLADKDNSVNRCTKQLYYRHFEEENVERDMGKERKRKKKERRAGKWTERK